MHEEVMDKMKEVISKLEGGLKQEDEKENLTNVVRIDSPKPVVDLKPLTGTQISETDSLEPDTKVVSPPSQVNITSPKPDIETTSPVHESIEVDTETAVTDFEDFVADLPSPSVIDKSQSGFEKIIPDDDATKSDIEMGNESPRLDIDSQPILVDIDAPLDDDPPESIIPQEIIVDKKPKKLSIKDSERPRKKNKREQKKKNTQKKWDKVDRVQNKLVHMQQRMIEMMREIDRKKRVCTSFVDYCSIVTLDRQR